MKKVLSVLLAAAMVMGMSVSAFAADFSIPGSAKDDVQNAANLAWTHAVHVRAGEFKAIAAAGSQEAIADFELLEGDKILFLLQDKTTNNYYYQGAPKNWILKAEANEYVADVDFINLTDDKDATTNDPYTALTIGNALAVEVSLAKDFNAKAEQEDGNVMELWMYIWDSKNNVKSDVAKMHYTFEKNTTVKISDTTRVYKAAPYTYYTLADGINSAMVVFGLNGDTYVTAKMWKGEKYMITSGVNAKWSKELSKQYDTDIEVLSFESDLDVREVLFEASKDNKQVVEVVDGELVAVDSEFVSKYELCEYFELSKGYIADAEENGTYALISADIELIEVEEEATEEETKENPSTGANDFVGAAVALAVVSVAAAGALALKK